MIRQNLFHIFTSQLIINHMSDFNVTKLENGDFKVSNTESSNNNKANLLYVVWVLFVVLVMLMSMSCSTNKSTFKNVRYCKTQLY
jgi:hypothetical protein